MPRLLIKQRVFSWTDTYDVYGEDETPKYFVKAEFLSLTHQIHVYDSRTAVSYTHLDVYKRQSFERLAVE